MSDLFQQISNEIPKLRRYARVLVQDQSDADDLVQDALARALAKIHLWQHGTDLRAWLFTILHNQHVNLVRRGVRQGPIAALDEREPPLQVAPSQFARLQLRDLDRALDQLPAEQRELILLAGLENLSYVEMADIVKVPLGTIRSRLSRGRDALRTILDEGRPQKHDQDRSHDTPATDQSAGRYVPEATSLAA